MRTILVTKSELYRKSMNISIRLIFLLILICTIFFINMHVYLTGTN